MVKIIMEEHINNFQLKQLVLAIANFDCVDVGHQIINFIFSGLD